MKYLRPADLARINTPAPALGRGVAIWMLLIQRFPRTLEEIAGQLKIPKASVYRLLESLCLLGIIQRLPDKRYEPLWGVQSLTNPLENLREELSVIMADLCRQSQCTVEWYEPSKEGMVLTLQNHPESEVRVQIRPGFTRRWSDEFEAVTRLGVALDAAAPPLKTARIHTSNGSLQNIGSREINRQLANVRQTKASIDLAFNGNGVRRCAVALMDGDRLRGVLALAEVFQFNEPSRADEWLKLLQRSLPV